MKTPLTLAVPLLLVSLAGAQSLHSPDQVKLVTFTTSLDPGVAGTAHAQLTGTPGTTFKLLGAPHQDAGFAASRATLAGEGVLDADGEAFLSWPLVDLQAMPYGAKLDYLAVLEAQPKSGGTLGQASHFSNKSVMALGAPVHCQDLDFDFTIGPVEPVAGQLIDEQWSSIGLHISAENNVPGHPDKAIVFDSSNPTGNDTDLQTPGYGPGNDTALGKLLIIAQDDIDADMDGLVDDPNDEAGGGWLIFAFDSPVAICSATVVDIDDENPSRIAIHFADGSPPAILVVPALGDNSVQTIGLAFSGVERLEFRFAGSGAVANVGFQPCPSVLTLDETMTGKPTYFRPGTVMTDQYLAVLGISISAVNNHVFPVAHPDKALVFDTSNPTGGDTDLATPGPGIGNTTALGKVLIIAENDVDVDGDGVVDDPDDEAFGGVLRFDFDAEVAFLGGTVLDIDTNEGAFFSLRDAADQVISVIPLVNLGDNSVQVVDLARPVAGVHAVELHMSGSGALARLRWCPPGEGDDGDPQ